MFVGSFISVEANDGANNTTSDVLSLRHTTTGVGANGIGGLELARTKLGATGS